MLPLINPLPIALVIATTFGLLMHDTRVDRAAVTAIVNPGGFTDAQGIKSVSDSNEHVHVEKVSVSRQAAASTARSASPRTQVRDDNQYILTKKAVNSGGDGLGLWPSV